MIPHSSMYRDYRTQYATDAKKPELQNNSVFEVFDHTYLELLKNGAFVTAMNDSFKFTQC